MVDHSPVVFRHTHDTHHEIETTSRKRLRDHHDLNHSDRNKRPTLPDPSAHSIPYRTTASDENDGDLSLSSIGAIHRSIPQNVQIPSPSHNKAFPRESLISSRQQSSPSSCCNPTILHWSYQISSVIRSHLHSFQHPLQIKPSILTSISNSLIDLINWIGVGCDSNDVTSITSTQLLSALRTMVHQHCNECHAMSHWDTSAPALMSQPQSTQLFTAVGIWSNPDFAKHLLNLTDTELHSIKHSGNSSINIEAACPHSHRLSFSSAFIVGVISMVKDLLIELFTMIRRNVIIIMNEPNFSPSEQTLKMLEELFDSAKLTTDLRLDVQTARQRVREMRKKFQEKEKGQISDVDVVKPNEKCDLNDAVRPETRSRKTTCAVRDGRRPLKVIQGSRSLGSADEGGPRLSANVVRGGPTLSANVGQGGPRVACTRRVSIEGESCEQSGLGDLTAEGAPSSPLSSGVGFHDGAWMSVWTTDGLHQSLAFNARQLGRKKAETLARIAHEEAMTTGIHPTRIRTIKIYNERRGRQRSQKRRSEVIANDNLATKTDNAEGSSSSSEQRKRNQSFHSGHSERHSDVRGSNWVPQSGVKGVVYDTASAAWRTSYREETGRLIYIAHFAVRGYGFENAKRMAILAKEKQEKFKEIGKGPFKAYILDLYAKMKEGGEWEDLDELSASALCHETVGDLRYQMTDASEGGNSVQTDEYWSGIPKDTRIDYDYDEHMGDDIKPLDVIDANCNPHDEGFRERVAESLSAPPAWASFPGPTVSPRLDIEDGFATMLSAIRLAEALETDLTSCPLQTSDQQINCRQLNNEASDQLVDHSSSSHQISDSHSDYNDVSIDNQPTNQRHNTSTMCRDINPSSDQPCENQIPLWSWMQD